MDTIEDSNDYNAHVSILSDLVSCREYGDGFS
jgi:hypothetical protein